MQTVGTGRMPADHPVVAAVGARARVPAVAVWAAVGAALAAFEVYLLVKWVTGSSFERVPSGPSVPPGWMRATIDITQVVSVLGLVFFLFWFLIRPWMRERRLTLDGMLCVALLLTSIYDPLSSYFQNWFGYNAYFMNRGSPVTEIPGWQSFAKPGAMIAWPGLFIASAYVCVFLGIMHAGAWIMGAARRRWPDGSRLVLVAICFSLILVIDVVLEGVLFMRLGFYSETDLGLALSSGTTHQLPISNIVFATLLWTTLTCFRFFRDDRGQTIAERRSQQLGDTRKTTARRMLAVIAAVQVITLVTYHVPQGLIAKNTDITWPEAISSKSYLTDHICGKGTERPCP